MTKDNMQDEIEALRAQVAELTAERKAREKQQAEATGAGESAKASTAQKQTTTETSEAEDETSETEQGGLAEQFQELIDTIDHELKEANPITLLVVFAIGVLLGRLLPR